MQSTPNEIIAGPVQDAVRAGTCIYTVGFGDPGDIDEDLLHRIATNSGCGEYYYATDVSELERIYISVRHQSTGTILAEFLGTIAQGETVQAGNFDVPPAQGELALSLHWPGSKLELRLLDPQGQIVDENYPNASLITYRNLVYALILQPIPGTWLVEIIGTEIPQGTTTYDVTASSRAAPVTPLPPTPLPTPPPPTPTSGFPVVLFLFLLAGGGVALYVYAITLRRRRVGVGRASKGMGNPKLIFVNGTRAGETISFGKQPLTIGRGSANLVQVPDISVSRLHAIIRYAQGRWFLQDQGSKAGTLVNDRQVSATKLKNGDRIQIGSIEIVFRIDSI